MPKTNADLLTYLISELPAVMEAAELLDKRATKVGNHLCMLDDSEFVNFNSEGVAKAFVLEGHDTLKEIKRLFDKCTTKLELEEMVNHDSLLEEDV